MPGHQPLHRLFIADGRYSSSQRVNPYIMQTVRMITYYSLPKGIFTQCYQLLTLKWSTWAELLQFTYHEAQSLRIT